VYRLPSQMAGIPGAYLAQQALAVAGWVTGILRRSRGGQARRWKKGWRGGLDKFPRLLLKEKLAAHGGLARPAPGRLAGLELRLPVELWEQHIRIPSAFRKQDLTPFDVLALGRKFITRFPDRRQPILIVGLRTAGAYFAPLLRALLQSEGYQAVDTLTV